MPRRGFPLSPDVRAKIAARMAEHAASGRLFAPEHRMKLMLAQQARRGRERIMRAATADAALALRVRRLFGTRFA